MTFDEIVSRVMNRLNLSSVDATNRIGEFVNERYKSATSSIGLQPVRRQKTDVVVTAMQAGLPEITATDYDKINRIMLVVTTNTPNSVRLLKERTYDEVTMLPTNSALPRAWAVKNLGAHSVTYVLDSYPTNEEFTLRLDGYTRQTDISSTTEPVFPEDFHDLLIHGARADELRKMEKDRLADQAEAKYEARLSDLRMFIAKSSYLDIVQNKANVNYLPWYSTSDWPYL